MNRLVLLAVVSLFALGCAPRPTATPVPVPAGTTIEIYSTAAAAGPNTKAGVDPSTNAVINLVTPPVITTVDIATVARSEMEIETVGNAAPPYSVPSLEIVLNAAGTKKMLAATTAPTSPNLAVVVNGVVISVPNIVTPINRSFRVTGDHGSAAYLNALAAATGQP